jgi:hypothetical protein
VIHSDPEPDPEAIADAVRREQRADRDETTTEDIERTERIAKELAKDED